LRIIHNPVQIQKAIEQYEINKIFDNLSMDFFLVEYQKNEYIHSPIHNKDWLQIQLRGEIIIYFIKEDGNIYTMAAGAGHSRIGEFESFVDVDVPVYTQAKTEVTTLAFSMQKHKEMLLNDMTFLRSTVYNLSNQIYTITHFAANPMPLQERVINYMYFNCQNQILKGIEECAKIFHCSGRHLHRVLGEMEAAGLVKKINRGSYQLLSSPDKVSDK
jgi:CRP/FNR family putative post-exponential-phase nitrogen-starvation transcriptional regulator